MWHFYDSIIDTTVLSTWYYESCMCDIMISCMWRLWWETLPRGKRAFLLCGHSCLNAIYFTSSFSFFSSSFYMTKKDLPCLNSMYSSSSFSFFSSSSKIHGKQGSSSCVVTCLNSKYICYPQFSFLVLLHRILIFIIFFVILGRQ